MRYSGFTYEYLRAANIWQASNDLDGHVIEGDTEDHLRQLIDDYWAVQAKASNAFGKTVARMFEGVR